MVMFGDVETFLTAHNDIAPSMMNKLRVILSDLNDKSKLKLELAVIVDAQ